MNSFAPLLSAAHAVKPGTVQRKCGCGNPDQCQCDKQKDKGGGAIQRRANASAAKAAPPANAVSAPVASGIQSASQGGGHGLPSGVRRQMESGFGGRDLSNVRVHNDGRAHQLADSLQAQAFTTGNHIFFGANQYQPESKPGQHLLAHELTHVVQQSHAGASAVQPRLELGAVDTPAEREADRIADAITRGFSASPAMGVPRPLVQRAPKNPTLAGVPPGTPVTQPLAGKGEGAVAITLPESEPFLLPAEKAESDADFDWLYSLYQTAAHNHRLRTTHAGRADFLPPTANYGDELWSIWAAGRPHDTDVDKVRGTGKCSPDHIHELQVGGADSPNNLRLLERGRNQKAGSDIWNKQIGPLLRAYGIGTNAKKSQGWLEFTAVKKTGQLEKAEKTKPFGRVSNDPDCMAKDPTPQPQGAITIQRFLKTLSFVAGGAPNRIGYRSDGAVPTVYQFAVAGAQMNEVVAKNDGTHVIHSEISPYVHRFPVQGSRKFDFRTTGPQPTEDAEPPELEFVTKPPGNIRLDFPFMSSAFLTPRLDERQFRASGDLTPTKPILKEALVHLELADGELRGGVKLDANALRKALPIPGLTIDPVTLEIAIRNGDWFATGGFDFQYGKLVKGHLEASFANGVQGSGWFDLLIPGLDEARGEVWIKDGRFGGELRLSKKQIKLPFVKSAALVAAIRDGVFEGSGSLVLEIPSLKDAPLKFMANSQGDVSFSGTATASIPGIKDLSVEFGYKTPMGIFADGHGSLGVPGLDSVTVDAHYMAGVLSGGVQASYSKGRLKGMLKVWLTREHKLGGHGEVSYEIVKGFPVLVAVDVLEDGTTKIAEGFRLPDPLPLFKKPFGVHPTIFDHDFEIPLFGFPGVDLEAVIGVKLEADASIGPAEIRGGKITSDFDPTREGQELGFKAEGSLVIPAHAGVAFSFDGGLGLRVLIAKAKGTIGFTAGVELCGALIAPVTLEYKDGTFTIDACACLTASPCVYVEGHADVRVYLDLLLGTIDLYTNHWTLGEFDWGSDFTIGVMFPFHYAIGRDDDFKLPDDGIKFIHPDISLSDLLHRLLPV